MAKKSLGKGLSALLGVFDDEEEFDLAVKSFQSSALKKANITAQSLRTL